MMRPPVIALFAESALANERTRCADLCCGDLLVGGLAHLSASVACNIWSVVCYVLLLLNRIIIVA